MEPLQKRSDGIFETPSGRFAVIPLRQTGTLGRNAETSFFRFRSHVLAAPVEIRWRTGDAFIIVPQDTALSLLQLGYAENIGDELHQRYTLELEKYLATAPAGTGDFVPPNDPPAGGEFIPPGDTGEFVPPGGIAPGAPSGDNPASAATPAPSGKKGK